MAAAYLLGFLFVVAYAQGGILADETAIIEDLRDATTFSAGRIVAGQPVVEGQIPYQCSLRMVNEVGSVFSCGGSVIHNQWVLTAAHCLANRYSFVVRYGVLNITRPEIIVESNHKYIHPEYDEIRAGVQTADIALLRVNEFISYSATVQPIRLQTRAQKNSDYSGVSLIVSGFGRTDDLWHGGASSEILLYVQQRGISNEECRGWYPTSTVIRDQTICTRFYDNLAQSPCQGDSGGPLTVVDFDGTVTQVGVVSFVHVSGCNSTFPAGYVRPGHYHDWFENVTGLTFDWDSDAIGQEPEDSSPDSQEPEESNPESQESEDSSSESQEPEDSIPESQEAYDRVKVVYQ